MNCPKCKKVPKSNADVWSKSLLGSFKCQHCGIILKCNKSMQRIEITGIVLGSLFGIICSLLIGLFLKFIIVSNSVVLNVFGIIGFSVPLFTTIIRSRFIALQKGNFILREEA